MNLPCVLIKDLLPLYAEQMTGEETNALVREHLEGCPACREALNGLEKPEITPAESLQAMQKLKKSLRARRWRTAALAALIVFLPLFTFFARSTVKQYLPYSEGLVTVEGVKPYDPSEPFPGSGGFTGYGVRDDEYQAEALYLSYAARVNGIQQEMVQDIDSGEWTLFIMAYSWPSVEYLIDDTIERPNLHIGAPPAPGPDQRGTSVIAPAPDRVIYGFGSDQVLLYGGPKNGGMEILPRLVLGYYLLIALAMAAVLGLLALLLRRKKAGPILRQLFLVPVSWVLGHLLVKGLVTVSFDAQWDFLMIFIAAAASYALLSLVLQMLRQWKKDRE